MRAERTVEIDAEASAAEARAEGAGTLATTAMALAKACCLSPSELSRVLGGAKRAARRVYAGNATKDEAADAVVRLRALVSQMEERTQNSMDRDWSQGCGKVVGVPRRGAGFRADMSAGPGIDERAELRVLVERSCEGLDVPFEFPDSQHWERSSAPLVAAATGLFGFSDEDVARLMGCTVAEVDAAARGAEAPVGDVGALKGALDRYLAHARALRREFSRGGCIVLGEPRFEDVPESCRPYLEYAAVMAGASCRLPGEEPGDPSDFGPPERSVPVQARPAYAPPVAGAGAEAALMRRTLMFDRRRMGEALGFSEEQVEAWETGREELPDKVKDLVARWRMPPDTRAKTVSYPIEGYGKRGVDALTARMANVECAKLAVLDTLGRLPSPFRLNARTGTRTLGAVMGTDSPDAVSRALFGLGVRYITEMMTSALLGDGRISGGSTIARVVRGLFSDLRARHASVLPDEGPLPVWDVDAGEPEESPNPYVLTRLWTFEDDPADLSFELTDRTVQRLAEPEQEEEGTEEVAAALWDDARFGEVFPVKGSAGQVWLNVDGAYMGVDMDDDGDHGVGVSWEPVFSVSMDRIGALAATKGLAVCYGTPGSSPEVPVGRGRWLLGRRGDTVDVALVRVGEL